MSAQTFSFEQLDVPPAPPPRAARAMSRDEAVSEAEALLAAAETEAARIREDARRAGFEAGRQEALADMHGQLGPGAQALAQAVDGLTLARAEAADRVEAHAVDLALMLTEKIVAGAVKVQPERVVDVVRGALRLLTDRERLTIVVNPADLDIVRTAIGEVSAQMGGFKSLDLQSDRRLDRGDALVRTAVGEIDATVETKLERAREVLERELAQ